MQRVNFQNHIKFSNIMDMLNSPFFFFFFFFLNFPCKLAAILSWPQYAEIILWESLTSNSRQEQNLPESAPLHVSNTVHLRGLQIKMKCMNTPNIKASHSRLQLNVHSSHFHSSVTAIYSRWFVGMHKEVMSEPGILVSEWVIKFNGLFQTVDIRDHVIHISRVTIAYTLESSSSLT